MRTCVLRRKDARARQTAENAQIEHKQQLIDDRDRRHLQCADTSDHHIVQQTDHVGHRVLNDNGHDDSDHLRIKIPIAEHPLPKPAPA